MSVLFSYKTIECFLDESLCSDLLNYAIDKKDNFLPATVYKAGLDKVNPKTRISLINKDIDHFKPILLKKISKNIPNLVEALKIPTFELGEIEIELAAHGNGAFFAQHIDTIVHKKETSPRAISAVYYLHSQPKMFTGGQLRLHPMPFLKGDDQPIDIEPDHNTLVAFPSWAPHEVLPVICPDNDFKNWRFAINCWIHKA
jgi:Rps23 Pro-64 3,4-dihydroxylase Tpa1-like proline 4-hydroxylase